MALGTRARTGRTVDGLVHHSDAGSQYTAIRYATRLLDAGALGSIGSVGDSFVYRPSRQPATGPPGSYPDRTSAGKRRRAYDRRSTTPFTSSLLGARNPRLERGQAVAR
jgi:hypothetical protein